MASIPVYEPLTFVFSTPQSIWLIQHNLGRSVTSQVYNDLGEQIFPLVVEQSVNEIRLYFENSGTPFSVSGKVIVT